MWWSCLSKTWRICLLLFTHPIFIFLFFFHIWICVLCERKPSLTGWLDMYPDKEVRALNSWSYVCLNSKVFVLSAWFVYSSNHFVSCMKLVNLSIWGGARNWKGQSSTFQIWAQGVELEICIEKRQALHSNISRI